MQIRTTEVGEYIAKLLATKSEVVIYEVEEWGFCSIDVSARDRNITYFTTLEEAKHQFDNLAELNKYSREYTNSVEDVCATLSYRKEGCTLRKITANLSGSRKDVLATNSITQIFKIYDNGYMVRKD